MEIRYWTEAKTDKKGKSFWTAWKQAPLPEPNPHKLYFKARCLGYFDTLEVAGGAIETDINALVVAV